MNVLTNKMGLPQAIYDAVKNDSYTRGDSDISVTSLIAPPRKVALEAKHHDEMSEDCSDRIWSLLGQSIHTILERANRVGIAERRLYMQSEGWKISGGMDLYLEDGVIVDYKTTSAWSLKGENKPEWEEQLNCYAEILRQNGHPVTGLRIVAILRDWSKIEARRDPEYPRSQVAVREIKLWPAEFAQGFIRSRVILHQQARVTLPLCTPEERWARPNKYALMKKGGKRAVKLYDSEADAKSHAETDLKNLYVEDRPGEQMRCSAYCGAAPFCTQYQAITQTAQSSQKEALNGQKEEVAL